MIKSLPSATTLVVSFVGFLLWTNQSCLCVGNSSTEKRSSAATENSTSLTRLTPRNGLNSKQPYNDLNEGVIDDGRRKNVYKGNPKPVDLEIIPASQSWQTIGQLYGQSTWHKFQQSPAQRQQEYTQAIRRDVLILLLFERDYAQWNPRDNNSQWQWLGVSEGLRPADNAAIVRHAAARKYSGDKKKNKRLGETNGKQLGFVDFTSEPFDRFYPSSDSNNAITAYEGFVEYKNTIAITTSQRILFRLKSACKIINADRHPFPSTLVANPWNDPRLAACAFQVNSVNTNETFLVETTNEGVWAAYSRSGPSTTVVAKRRIGLRKTYHDIVDAGIEIDGRENVVNWYLNGYRVWSINRPGIPPPDDGMTKIDGGHGPQQNFTRPSNFSVLFGTLKCLDESDPNNAASPTRLVPVYGLNSSNYDISATFYAPDSFKSNNIWGQSAIFRLYKLLIVRADSVVPVATFLPTEFEAVSNKDNVFSRRVLKTDEYHIL